MESSTLRSELVAKSPCSERPLVGRKSRRGGIVAVAAAAGAQAVAGVLMVTFGALCAAHGATLARLGAGLWGGLVAALAGLLGGLALLRPRGPAPVFLTAYLALSLVSLAVNTLVIVLTLTAVVRDANIDPDLLTDQGESGWAGRWSGVGLVAAAGLHAAATLVALPAAAALRRPPPEPAKAALVRSWLQRVPYPYLPPPPIGIDGRSIYTVPYSRPPSRHRPPSHKNYFSNVHQHNMINHHNNNNIIEKKPEKKPELSEADIEKTYTGLDREIAEEFISIAMQPKPSLSQRSESSVSHIFP